MHVVITETVQDLGLSILSVALVKYCFQVSGQRPLEYLEKREESVRSTNKDKLQNNDKITIVHTCTCMM